MFDWLTGPLRTQADPKATQTKPKQTQANPKASQSQPQGNLVGKFRAPCQCHGKQHWPVRLPTPPPFFRKVHLGPLGVHLRTARVHLGTPRVHLPGPAKKDFVRSGPRTHPYLFQNAPLTLCWGSNMDQKGLVLGHVKPIDFQYGPKGFGTGTHISQQIQNGKMSVRFQTLFGPSWEIRLQIKPIDFQYGPKGFGTGTHISQKFQNGKMRVRFQTPLAPSWNIRLQIKPLDFQSGPKGFGTGTHLSQNEPKLKN